MGEDTGEFVRGKYCIESPSDCSRRKILGLQSVV